MLLNPAYENLYTFTLTHTNSVGIQCLLFSEQLVLADTALSTLLHRDKKLVVKSVTLSNSDLISPVKFDKDLK